ncbi:uncharacterized protein [Fopius arisanus]|uniref:Chitin-binding type-2 domain-containing protein n=1 Tax=Fopius arisanus TaxID=64838 RepID=A0A9R1U1H0_9HYME|nr:PREDICTED: uncharacterized protein LOC105267467 [Fopius arisanus]
MPSPVWHIVILMLVKTAWGQFQCPEPKGFFGDPEQCDLYYICTNSKPEEKLCKDGLVFRDDNPKKELCDIPANVPCGDRTLLRELLFYLLLLFSIGKYLFSYWGSCVTLE